MTKKDTTKNKEENFQIILFVKKMSIYLYIKRERVLRWRSQN